MMVAMSSVDRQSITEGTGDPAGGRCSAGPWLPPDAQR